MLGERLRVPLGASSCSSFVAFPTAEGAVGAAADASEALAAGPIRVRMGIHTGTPHLSGEGYVGEDVHLGARIAAAGHGGQVLVSTGDARLVEAGLADLGEHRLKDFDEPVVDLPARGGALPAARRRSRTRTCPARPRRSSAGSASVDEVDRAAAGRRAAGHPVRPGRSGKTRLAIEAAPSWCREFKAGVFWVGLAALRDPALVTETIAQTLGAKDGLAEHIGEREMLLLLDNFEQVVDAAPELAALLEACPNLQPARHEPRAVARPGRGRVPGAAARRARGGRALLRRARLEPDDDDRRAVPPAGQSAARGRAGRCAHARALPRRRSSSGSSQRLDLFEGRKRCRGAPADAARDDRVEPRPARRTRSSACSRGWPCSPAAARSRRRRRSPTPTWTSLQSLVDKSLVRHTDERFWMLETIREFALERLEETGGADVLRER